MKISKKFNSNEKNKNIFKTQKQTGFIPNKSRVI
jgi:hypothetical protein